MNDSKENLPAYLTPTEVADRLRISLRTLEGWRYQGNGPTFTKVGNKVLYRREAIMRFEALGDMKPGANHGEG
ncbi:MAG: helix-turn-helix domain-containing protein [Pseudomonadota bacterium]